MTIRHAVYETATGRVRWFTTSLTAPDLSFDATLAPMLIPDAIPDQPGTYWVEAGALTARPMLAFDKLAIAADDMDVATLSGLPDPCIVNIDGVDHTVTGGVLEVTSAQKTAFAITITDADAHPAQAFGATVTAS
jgi:hypothetical protein